MGRAPSCLRVPRRLGVARRRVRPHDARRSPAFQAAGTSRVPEILRAKDIRQPRPRPKVLRLRQSQPVNPAGEHEPASGALDDLPHLGPVAHVRFLAGDRLRAPVLVFRLRAKLEKVDHRNWT